MRRRIVDCAVLLAVIALLIANCADSRNSAVQKSNADNTDQDIRANVEMLSAMELQDVSAVQEQVDAAKTQNEVQEDVFECYVFAPDADSVDLKEYKSMFSGCVVMGDSIATGLSDYGFLLEDQVIAQKGLTMRRAEEEGYIEQLKIRDPQVIFLSFGLNDLILYQGDSDKFCQRYDSFLTLIHETCPDARVYVNSVFPVVAPMTEEKPYLADMDRYNALLEYISSQNNAQFIDNTAIATEDRYADDGAHFKKSMYRYWLYNMALSASLS